ncbi:MAG: aryl-sulfate sulfotransferase [Limisphaerales bacterium]
MKTQVLMARWIVVCSTLAWSLIFSQRLLAITILSGPTFTPAPSAPLAGVLQLTTDVPSRVSILVSNGTNIWERDFYQFATSNSVPLYGFQAGQTNLILVTVYDEYQNSCTAPQLLTFKTAPLPSDFPELTLLTNVPSQVEPGDTAFIVQNRADFNAYITIVDSSGQVIWYRQVLESSDIDVQQQPDGNLFIHEQSPANKFVEMNLLGNVVQTWAPASGYPINSHVGILTDRGTILYLSDVSTSVADFPSLLPSSSTNINPPLETVTVDDNPVVEVSTNGTLVNVWSPLTQLDPTRVTYITGDFPSSFGLDTEHANAVVDDTNDNSIIVSLRDQNAIYKFSRLTGKLIWILAPNDSGLAPDASWPTNFQKYLLTPVGTPFEWCYAQHGPTLTPQGTLLVLDDGDDRASPFEPIVSDPDNYSRAVEYNIDETNMTVSQVWDSYDRGLGGGDRLYTFILGNADWEPQTRTVLATYGWINYTNGQDINNDGATMARIVEYTHDPVPQVVWDLSVWNYDGPQPNSGGFYVYRSHRIPDLYAHPAEPVNNIVITRENQLAYLGFAADPTYSYVVQASTDLQNWTTVGAAVEEDGNGDFGFDDLTTSKYAARFYRVVTVPK